MIKIQYFFYFQHYVSIILAGRRKNAECVARDYKKLTELFLKREYIYPLKDKKLQEDNVQMSDDDNNNLNSDLCVSPVTN